MAVPSNMRSHLSTADYATWVASFVLEIAILLVMWRKNELSAYPAFAVYLGFSAFKSAVLFAIAQLLSYATYFYAYWGGMGIKFFISCWVAYEVCERVFQPYDLLHKRTLQFFVNVAGVAFTLSILIAMYDPAKSHNALYSICYTLNRSTALVMAAIFGLTAALSQFLALPWNQRVRGLIFGFGFFLLVDCAVSSSYSSYGAATIKALRPLAALAYVIAEAIWFYHFNAAEDVIFEPTLEDFREVEESAKDLSSMDLS